MRLLTPVGWDDRRPGQRWPVLYLLHGCCGDYTSWTSLTDVASITALRDVLVVMPEAGNTGFYSNWWNAGAGGPPAWETFHLREVRQILERGYGAGHRRVVAGLSMGGFGALSYAARNPGMFRATAAYSGVVDTRSTPRAPPTSSCRSPAGTCRIPLHCGAIPRTSSRDLGGAQPGRPGASAAAPTGLPVLRQRRSRSLRPA